MGKSPPKEVIASIDRVARYRLISPRERMAVLLLVLAIECGLLLIGPLQIRVARFDPLLGNYVLALGVIAFFVSETRRKRRVRAMAHRLRQLVQGVVLCPRCDYPVPQSGDVCPECGKSVIPTVADFVPNGNAIRALRSVADPIVAVVALDHAMRRAGFAFHHQVMCALGTAASGVIGGMLLAIFLDLDWFKWVAAAMLVGAPALFLGWLYGRLGAEVLRFAARESNERTPTIG